MSPLEHLQSRMGKWARHHRLPGWFVRARRQRPPFRASGANAGSLPTTQNLPRQTLDGHGDGFTEDPSRRPSLSAPRSSTAP